MIISGRSLLASIAACVLLAGCAQHEWAPGPNAQGSFDEAKAQCSLMARHSGGSYYARGTPAFVGGAMAGAVIGESIRAQADFNDCMSASGWLASDAKDKSEMAAERDKIKALGEENKMCVAAARTNPKYGPILSHLQDLNVRGYSLTQMSDMTVPSEEEGKLLASYGDETDQCWSKMAASINALEPSLNGLLTKAHSVARDLALRLIQRQITWGQYARATQDFSDQAKTGRVPTAPVIIPASNVSAASEHPMTAPQTAGLVRTPDAHVCTHDEQVQARVAKMNGYTGGPHCD